MALINYVTRIQFAAGALSTLKDEVAIAGIKKPMIVTDQGVRALGYLERLEAALDETPVAVFDETPGNPTETAVRAATQTFISSKADGIIAIGGGSALDLAKAVAILAAHGGALKTYAAIEGGMEKITAKTFPTIAIPTTAGTGSEVGRGAVIILEDGRKVGLLSPYIVPKTAIVDPDLTTTLPPHLTAATGMDAISHCIETFLASAINPPADGIALEGLRLAWHNIEEATHNGENGDARANMAIAATMGAMAFQKGLGCVHSLSHALGGQMPRLHHGMLNAVLMPAVLTFNADEPSVVASQKFKRIAAAMGLEKPEDVIPALREMTERLGLPRTLSEIGVDDTIFDAVIQGALADHCHKTNPKIASAVDYRAMLAASL